MAERQPQEHIYQQLGFLLRKKGKEIVAALSYRLPEHIEPLTTRELDITHPIKIVLGRVNPTTFVPTPDSLVIGMHLGLQGEDEVTFLDITKEATCQSGSNILKEGNVLSIPERARIKFEIKSGKRIIKITSMSHPLDSVYYWQSQESCQAYELVCLNSIESREKRSVEIPREAVEVLPAKLVFAKRTLHVSFVKEDGGKWIIENLILEHSLYHGVQGKIEPGINFVHLINGRLQIANFTHSNIDVWILKAESS